MPGLYPCSGDVPTRTRVLCVSPDLDPFGEYTVAITPAERQHPLSRLSTLNRFLPSYIGSLLSLFAQWAIPRLVSEYAPGHFWLATILLCMTTEALVLVPIEIVLLRLDSQCGDAGESPNKKVPVARESQTGNWVAIRQEPYAGFWTVSGR